MAIFCRNCGTNLVDGVNFCSSCGAPTGFAGAVPPGVVRVAGPLMRVREFRQIAGVCAGFARSYGWDLTLVRILTVVAAILIFPIPEIGYLICWIAMPEEPLSLPAGMPYPPPSI